MHKMITPYYLTQSDFHNCSISQTSGGEAKVERDVR